MTNLQEYNEFMSVARRVVIVTHYKPDADALGSSLGLSAFLKKDGHHVTVITPSDYPAFLNWLPGNDEVVIFSEALADKVKTLVTDAEIIFCLDFSALSRINTIGEMIQNASGKKVLIDHHLEPEKFADFEQWDAKAASTAGLVYELIIELGERAKIDSTIADCLYAGLLTDTGGFRHNNTRREEFMIASDLVSLGANPTRVSKLIY